MPRRDPEARRKEHSAMVEPWILERQRQNAWDQYLRRRPKCALCGEPIVEDRALALNGQYYCEECVFWHTEEVEVLDAGLEEDPTGL